MDLLSSSVCRSCRSRLSITNATRSFSTSTRRQIIPPESPSYVDVPKDFQPNLPRQRRQKGLLPVPRELFPASRPDKPSQQYLDNLTQSPLPKNEVPYESLSELGQYRYRMAQIRKKNVREGLTELHQRKVNTEARKQHRSLIRTTERARLISQPQREDVRLTNNTIPEALRLGKSATPIADDLAAAKAIYEQKVANYSAHMAAKNDERMDALHTLYMNAREFITTEEQLDDKIDSVFRESIFGNDVRSDAKSMWNKGPPDTIKDMIANMLGQSDPRRNVASQVARGVQESDQVRFKRDQGRMKKIAEKLSGGKM